jgi:hypothetical protein
LPFPLRFSWKLGELFIYIAEDELDEVVNLIL